MSLKNFSDSVLGKYTKVKVIFHLKENAVPVFKPKLNVPFAVMEPIIKELGGNNYGIRR